jgi:uncharacterized membrane protein
VNDVPPPPPPYGAVPPGYGSPPVGTALSYGFNKYFANVGPVLSVVFVSIAAQIVLSLLGQVVVRSLVGVFIFQILGWIVGAIAALGIYKMALMITAGQTPEVGKAFQYDRWGEWFVFSIAFGLIVGVGLVLCIIPGLVALAFFGMAPYFFIDRGMSVGESLKASRQAATSRGFALPVVLSILVGAAGLIACGIGALVTAPAAYIAVAFLYRNAAGQPVAP